MKKSLLFAALVVTAFGFTAMADEFDAIETADDASQMEISVIPMPSQVAAAAATKAQAVGVAVQGTAVKALVLKDDLAAQVAKANGMAFDKGSQAIMVVGGKVNGLLAPYVAKVPGGAKVYAIGQGINTWVLNTLVCGGKGAGNAVVKIGQVSTAVASSASAAALKTLGAAVGVPVYLVQSGKNATVALLSPTANFLGGLLKKSCQAVKLCPGSGDEESAELAD